MALSVTAGCARGDSFADEISNGAPAGNVDGAAPSSSSCGTDLSNIGTADFRISLTLSTSQLNVSVAVANQRDMCGGGMFWDMRLADGALRMQTDDGNNPTDLSSTGPPVNDGLPHHLAAHRASGVLTLYVDGAAVGSSSAPPAAFTQLAPLVSGTDVCRGTRALMGTITDLCVSSR
jgi:hypothetical protein